jgi:hypothetical protein
MDSALQDQAEEYEARIAQLERDLHGQARAKIQLGRLLSEERAYHSDVSSKSSEVVSRIREVIQDFRDGFAPDPLPCDLDELVEAIEKALE